MFPWFYGPCSLVSVSTHLKNQSSFLVLSWISADTLARDSEWASWQAADSWLPWSIGRQVCCWGPQVSKPVTEGCSQGLRLAIKIFSLSVKSPYSFDMFSATSWVSSCATLVFWLRMTEANISGTQSLGQSNINAVLSFLCRICAWDELFLVLCCAAWGRDDVGEVKLFFLPLSIFKKLFMLHRGAIIFHLNSRALMTASASMNGC